MNVLLVAREWLRECAFRRSSMVCFDHILSRCCTSGDQEMWPRCVAESCGRVWFEAASWGAHGRFCRTYADVSYGSEATACFERLGQL
eukprot:242657-Chlamydomonas_euryale.AAC.1